MKSLNILATLLLIAGLSLSLGCDDKSGSLGEKLDKAIDKGSQEIEGAKEKGKKALGTAGEKMDKAIEEGSEKIDDLKKKGGKALDNLGDK